MLLVVLHPEGAALCGASDEAPPVYPRADTGELTPVAEATRHRPDPSGLHVWDDGGYTLQGGGSHATNGDSDEFGGGPSLRARFRSTGTSDRSG